MERHPRASPIPVDNMGLSNFWVAIHGVRKPYVDQVYSLTRVSTLIATVLNMVGFDSSVPINCRVRIILLLRSS